MAERKAQNKYYPPDWDPKHGSINTYQNSHPLRDRARKLKEGILIVRFEMPFNIWCGGCERHIAMGVRFNAQKKAIGQYFSTKIWSFKMKCPSCSHQIEIQTDPKNAAYVVTSGGKRKEEVFDASDAHTMKLMEEGEKEKMDEDPFFRLEHLAEDKEKGIVATPWLERLEDLSHERHFDDYAQNRKLRQTFREEKKEIKQMHLEGAKLGLDLPLLAPSEDDLLEAEASSRRIGSSIYKKRDQQVSKVATSIFGERSATNASRQILAKSLKRGMDLNLLRKPKQQPVPAIGPSAKLAAAAPDSAPGKEVAIVEPGFDLLGIPD